MRNVYQEIIDEGNEILETGMGHLRRRTRTYTPVSLKTVQAWESGKNNALDKYILESRP